MNRNMWYLVFAALLLPISAQAQSIWTAPKHQDGITLEAQKPDFDNQFITDGAFASSVYFLSGRYTVHPSLRLGAEVGLSHFGMDADVPGVDLSETAFGNIGLSAEYLTPVNNLSATLGVHIPTATDNMGIVTGGLSDLQRPGSFSPDTWTISTLGDYSYALSSNFDLRVNGGPLMSIATFDDETETRFGLQYAAQGWYTTRYAMLGAGVNAFSDLSERDDELDTFERTSMAAGGSVIGKFGRYQPGVNVMVPVTKDYRDFVDWRAGLSLSVLF